MKNKSPFIARLFLALAMPGLIITPSSFASLSLYDSEIASDHGGGAGTLPYAAALTAAEVFDGTNATAFDFGNLTGPATIELIIEGDPVGGGQNGYIGVGTNSDNSLRYEQWDDLGTMGFTRSAVFDYDLGVPSPTEPTHVTYRWDGVSTMELFVDGALSGTVTEATFEMPMGAGLIGNVSDGGGQGMVGTIHRITTYDSALDDATILEHATAWLATGDPSIEVPLSIELSLNGTVQNLGFEVLNGGEANVLTITEIDVSGADAGKFTINTTLPLNINPGEQETLAFTFDPMAAGGTVEATFTFISNDLLNDEAAVQLSGLIRDPAIAVATELDFGVSDVPVTIPLTVENLGGTLALDLGALTVTGSGADKFSATGPASIPVGGSSNIDVTFTPDGTAGGFTAQLEIPSNDPGNAIALVDLSAITPVDEGFLTAYDSVIAADHGNGTGLIPHNALLTEPSALDTTNGIPFDFGLITGDATFEFILQGDPVGGDRDGFLAVGENTIFSLRYEQWDDTGALGFTHGGVEDYLFNAEGDVELLNSPTGPTHVAYLWQSALQTMSLFIDGVLAGTHFGSNFEMATGLGSLGNNAANNEGMLGTIHRATVYNNDIGADNITRHANAFLTGAGASDFLIISIEHDEGTNMATLVWNSTPNGIYAIDRSYDLTGWDELEDSVIATAATTSETVPTGLPARGTRVYFRIRLPDRN